MQHTIYTSAINLLEVKQEVEIFKQYGKNPCDLTEEEKMEIEYQENIDWYEIEKENLDKILDNNILVIADLGLWDGRHSGYKILGKNLNEILNIPYDESITVYTDNKNIKARGHHHDGTNYYIFRKIKPNRNINNLLEKLYNDEKVSSSMISYYTESLYPEVAKIYGW